MKFFSPDNNPLDAARSSEPLEIASGRLRIVDFAVPAVDSAVSAMTAELSQDSMLAAAGVVGAAFNSKRPDRQFSLTAVEQVAEPVAARPVEAAISEQADQPDATQSAVEPVQLPVDRLAEARDLVELAFSASERLTPPEFHNA